MENKYFFGFYWDHNIKGKPLICQVKNNVDSLSCELLGGIFPMLELSLSSKQRDKMANELALQYDASYIEIGNSFKKKVCNYIKIQAL